MRNAVFKRSTPAWVALAEKFVDQILTPEVSDEIKAHFKYNDGHHDPEKAISDFQRSLKYSIFLAIRSYTEWAASRIFRSQNFNPQPLPIYDDSDVQKIVLRFALRDEFIKLFFARLTKSEIILPILGKIMLVSVNPHNPEQKELRLFPDEASIRKLASYYNWSEPAE